VFAAGPVAVDLRLRYHTVDHLLI